MDINVRSNVKELQRKLSDLAYKQLPFATAQALTALAKNVQAGEKDAMGSIFDRPKPFTVNSVGITAARKDNLQATVYMKDIAAAYLMPYEFGGKNTLNSKALLKPVGAVSELDRFGNLPKNYLAKLRGRKDIFIGKVVTKAGEVNGVWQRTLTEGAKSVGVTRIDKKTGALRIGKTRAALNQTGHLKLLVRFEDAHPATQHMGWFKRAEHTVRSNFDREMGKALARAIASAK